MLKASNRDRIIANGSFDQLNSKHHLHQACNKTLEASRQDAVRDDWNCPPRQPRRGEGNRPNSRPTSPPQQRRNPRHQELGRFLPAPTRVQTPSAPPEGSLLRHALRLRDQDARGDPQDAGR